MTDETPEAQPRTTRMRVTAPFWCSGVTLRTEDGGTLFLNREGVEVPATARKSLTKQAATAGVTITEVSSK